MLFVAELTFRSRGVQLVVLPYGDLFVLKLEIAKKKVSLFLKKGLILRKMPDKYNAVSDILLYLID